MSEIQTFRQQVDEFMGRHPQSPLGYQAQRTFNGLSYYEPNPDYIVEAEVVPFPGDEPTTIMETSTGDRREYRRLAELRFKIEGQPVALTVYSDPAGQELFLPFKDQTNGDETYGAGRYLYADAAVDGKVTIDFNRAYNPPCAFTAFATCPLPPRQNWLKLAVEAGEKKYEGTH